MTYCDIHQRPIRYLRVSVTDRCNLRCIYCMPESGIRPCSHDDILRYEEIKLVVRAAADLGITKVRLTGGEPLVRKGIVNLVRELSCVPGIDDLSMTTNGTLLAGYAEALSKAGLHRVNVSLDSLRPERFRQITRMGDLQDALAGIEAAHRAGLRPIKINTVVIRGVNDDEVADLARKTVTDGWHVRFIEWMPVGVAGWDAGGWRESVVTAAEIRGIVEREMGVLEPAKLGPGEGPARYYRLPGASGTVGFITPVSDHFCHQCNRLRLTADGQLRPCLLSDRELDLRTPLRRGAGFDEIRRLLVEGIAQKPAQHRLEENRQENGRVMAQIGG